ncbi:hypothetical protein Tco_1438188 [Tanacetum coccineum]
MDLSILLMRWRDLGLSLGGKCLVLVDVLLILRGGVGGDESDSVVGDVSGVGGGGSGSVEGDDSGVVFGEVCVLGVFGFGVGDDCELEEGESCDFEKGNCCLLNKTFLLVMILWARQPIVLRWMLRDYVVINEWKSELESEWILPFQVGVCVFSQLWHFVEECMT